MSLSPRRDTPKATDIYQWTLPHSRQKTLVRTAACFDKHYRQLEKATDAMRFIDTSQVSPGARFICLFWCTRPCPYFGKALSLHATDGNPFLVPKGRDTNFIVTARLFKLPYHSEGMAQSRNTMSDS